MKPSCPHRSRLVRCLSIPLVVLLLIASGGATSPCHRDPSTEPAERDSLRLYRPGKGKALQVNPRQEKVYLPTDRQTTSLVAGGTYVISAGQITGGFYYRPTTRLNSSSSALGEQPLSLGGPVVRLSSGVIRLNQPAVQLDLMDLTGRKILSGRNLMDIKLTAPMGIYLLRVIFPTNTFICRLIVRK